MDIDHFKQVNDRYGHEAGNPVLKECTGLIFGTVGVGNLLGRIGGEAFAVLLPECSLDEAAGLAERCRAALEAGYIAFGSRVIRVSASFGRAPVQAGDAVIDDVLRRADRAHYDAKAAGRNRVHRVK